jgi:ABC-type polysaccharide/polyol phosphate transport system ATPase subunit
VTSPPAIELASVGKRYWKVEEPAMLLRSVLPRRRSHREELWALRHIDLQIRHGETVGVLGHNGAGKTSLLRLLAGVSQPTEGRLTITGRVAPLIGVGVGFHQEMSGRENVYVNGMLLGLTRAEIDRRFDEIVDFAELDAFIDTPVKFYSSGMFMRLGFSVAVHVRPQVLLVDEVLAVGDLAFQLKCFDRMRELKDSGATIVLVSHSTHAIRLLCPRAILLRRGHLEADGDVVDVIARHHELLSQGSDVSAPTHAGDHGASAVTIADRRLEGATGDEVHQLVRGVPVRLRAQLRFRAPVDSPLVHFTVLAEDGSVVYEMRSAFNRRHRTFHPGDTADVDVAFTPHLAGGSFRLLLAVTSHDGRVELHRDTTGLLVYVPPPLGSSGVAPLAATHARGGAPHTDHPLTNL